MVFNLQIQIVVSARSLLFSFHYYLLSKNDKEKREKKVNFKTETTTTTKKIYRMIEITCNDRLGKKVRIKCNPDDTIGDLKKLVAAQTGTNWERIVLKKWYTVFKDHVSLADYEIHDGMNLELYYQ